MFCVRQEGGGGGEVKVSFKRGDITKKKQEEEESKEKIEKIKTNKKRESLRYTRTSVISRDKRGEGVGMGGALTVIWMTPGWHERKP